MTAPFFSVITPTHNRAALLPLAVESVKQQTYSNWEIVIINDGSKDETAEVLGRLASEDQRIRPLTHEAAKGVSAARNAGVRAAQGDYVVLLDDDDQFKPALLERLADKIMAENFKPDILWAGREEIYYGPDGQVKEIKKQLWPAKLSAVRPGDFSFAAHFATSWGVAVRRAKMLAVGGFDEKITASEDLEFLVRMLGAGAVWAVVPDYLIDIHIKGPSLGRNTNYAKAAENIKRLIDNNRRFLDNCRPLGRHYRSMYVRHLYRAGLRAEARDAAFEILWRDPLALKCVETLIKYEIINPLKPQGKQLH